MHEIRSLSVLPFLLSTHLLLSENRHNLVEIFVNDSNARRTLQVGSNYIIGFNMLTKGLGRFFETHA